MNRPKDIPIGTRFGWLTVVAPAHDGWLCKCACGNKIIKEGRRLRQNNIKSCGCKAEVYRKTNGLTRIRNGRITSSMHQSVWQDETEL